MAPAAALGQSRVATLVTRPRDEGYSEPISSALSAYSAVQKLLTAEIAEIAEIADIDSATISSSRD